LSRRQRIEELNDKLSLLKEQRDKLEDEACGWAEKRNRRNERFKELRDEISGLRYERDKANEKVKELKLKRDEARARIKQGIEKIKTLRQEIIVVARKKPSQTFESLKEQSDSIEWKIQTTPLTLGEEKELVEGVKQVEAQLNVYRKLEQLRQKILNLQAEIKTLQAGGKSFHDELTKIAEKSQECHEKMLEKIEESKKVTTEADGLHQMFLQTRGKAKPIQEEIANVLNQMRQVKGEMRDEEAEERKRSEEAIRTELEQHARDKLKRGEKLTWEEFQLLAEKGMDQ
jgi:uncharacterized coiled-coil DUF342 family protein